MRAVNKSKGSSSVYKNVYISYQDGLMVLENKFLSHLTRKLAHSTSLSKVNHVFMLGSIFQRNI